jgi:4-hydroxyphenylpyruvate dioxygenase
MVDAKENPCELNGFAFLEFSAPKPALLIQQFTKMDFQKTSTLDRAAIHCYQQNQITFIINQEPNSQAERHAKSHGAGACAMGFYVYDAQKSYQNALQRGAQAFHETQSYYNMPAIQAIGGSVIYFVDDKNRPFANKSTSKASGLQYIDHLTHNVHRGSIDQWAEFYTTIFNFREVRYFDIVGQKTGLISRAMSSPCDKIKIPLNESKDDKSQIEEFLHDYNGEGIQHIALSTNTIYDTVHHLRANGTRFLDVPDIYYEMILNRVPWHQEPLHRLAAEKILLDGGKTPDGGLLLQIFTENVLGPVFFEIIERHGNQGFGEGNFQALFEAIERDQIQRGTL